MQADRADCHIAVIGVAPFVIARSEADEAIQLRTVIPGRAKREPGIHNHDREYGFRACAKRHIHDVHLHIGE